MTSLPVERPAAGGYYPEPLVLRQAANGAGVALIALPSVERDQRWWVEYLTVTCDGGTPSVAVYRDDPAVPSNLFDATVNGGGAVAPYQPARQVPPGGRLYVEFTGAPAGAVCSVTVEYRIERTG